MHQFPKFTPAWNSTCFGQFLCPSSGVYSLYTQQCYMSYRFVDSFRARPGWSCSKAVYKPVWHILLLSVQWINASWWEEELPETCRVSCRSKLGKLVHLLGFIIKKFVTVHGHLNVRKPPYICFLMQLRVISVHVSKTYEYSGLGVQSKVFWIRNCVEMSDDIQAPAALPPR